jgi:hypothetical protein
MGWKLVLVRFSFSSFFFCFVFFVWFCFVPFCVSVCFIFWVGLFTVLRHAQAFFT